MPRSSEKGSEIIFGKQRGMAVVQASEVEYIRSECSKLSIIRKPGGSQVYNPKVTEGREG